MEKKTNKGKINAGKQKFNGKSEAMQIKKDCWAESTKTACPVFEKCGGCQLLDKSYDKQLKWKKDQVSALLQLYGKIDGIEGMDQPEYYRHKVHAVFGRDKKGNIISGVYKEGTHIIVPVEKCLIENRMAGEIIQTIKRLLKSFKIKTYDEDTSYGLLRHVLVRVGYRTGQVMVVLVLGSPIMPSKNNFVKALRKEHPEITTVVVNVNDKRTSMILGDKEQVIYGPGYIEDELCGLTFKISPKSFYQINPEQTQKLYQTAIEYANLTGKETVLDAYCGTGTIGMIGAAKAGRVIGVELNKDAVRDAIEGARKNHISNIRFYQADAGEFMLKLAEAGEKIDVVLMDPPRSGSDEKFLSSVVRLKPERVVYISCNPETLARDLQYLCGKGYRMVKGKAYDLFPFTRHVETVVLLSQRKADDYVEVELELDELDVTSAESKATYKEIQEYVLKEYGLKVSNLYISQVKRKCGIEVGENYNLPKSEDSRQPQCPVEKEKAIKDALEHFGMM